MELVFKGHSFVYHVESMIKMFYPVARFHYASSVPEHGEWICAIIEREGDVLCVSVSANLQGSCDCLCQNIPFDADEIAQRDTLCSLVYRLLSSLCSVRLEWGMLTGVRPVKRVQKMLDSGLDFVEIEEILNKRFDVSKAKIDLLIKIAKVQREIGLTRSKRGIHLYVSIPFCPSRCHYCSFISQTATGENNQLLYDYLEALKREIAVVGELVGRLGLLVQTVYIGGGTPTVLSAEQLWNLTDWLSSAFSIENLVEYTVEAGRPDTITEEKLRVLLQAGVTRISVNPQTFEDDVLLAVGRNHTCEQTLQAFALARKIGFDHINMDLIVGLPNDCLRTFSNTIQQAIHLSPESITLHTLALKRSSAFYESAYRSVSKQVCAMLTRGEDALENAGYRPYYLYRQKNMIESLENVGYAKKGFESLYNIDMMDENQTVLSMGAGGATKLVCDDTIKRVFHFKYPREYIEGLEEMLARYREVETFYD